MLVAGDDVTKPKPDPEGVLSTLTSFDLPPNAPAAFIGDAAADIVAGKAAGLMTIAVTWGSPDHDELFATEPDVICSTVPDLATALGVDL